MNLVLIICSILVVLLGVFAIGKFYQKAYFKRQVQTLFSQSSIIQDKKFSYNQLSELPQAGSGLFQKSTQ